MNLSRRLWTSCLALVVVLGVNAMAGSTNLHDLFRYVGSDLQAWTTGIWYPARVVGGGTVEVNPGGGWINTGYTVDQLVAQGIIPPATPSSSTSSNAAALLAAQLQAQATAAQQQTQQQRQMTEAYYLFWQNLAREEAEHRNFVGSSYDAGQPGHLALADVLAASESWQLTLGGRADYSHSDYTFAPDASTDTYSAEVNALLKHDRWRIALGVPYEQVYGSTAAKAMESYRTGLRITPMYRLLDERGEALNLDLVTGIGYSFTHYGQAGSFGLRTDTNHFDTALGLFAGRTTPIGYLSLGYLYQTSWNLDGDKEGNGNSRLDEHAFAAGYSVPLCKRVFATFTGVYTYTPGLAPNFDRQDLNASAGLTYLLTSKWTLGCSVSHNFLNDSVRTWGAGADVGYHW